MAVETVLALLAQHVELDANGQIFAAFINLGVTAVYLTIMISTTMPNAIHLGIERLSSMEATSSPLSRQRRKMYIAAITGARLFFLGCASHHFMTALHLFSSHTQPSMYQGGWYWPMVTVDVLQVIGGWAFILLMRYLSVWGVSFKVNDDTREAG